MDPISAGLGIVGLGMQIFGGMQAANNAKQQAAVSQDEARSENYINQQKQMQMTLEATRQQTENFRNIQRARAQGLNSATNQGAQFGSGLQGGQAAATDQGYFNSLGINQNLQFGNSIYALNSGISQDKMNMATLGGQAATDQGIQSLGGAIMKAGPTIGAFAQNAGASIKSSNIGNSFFGGGSPSGYGT